MEWQTCGTMYKMRENYMEFIVNEFNFLEVRNAISKLTRYNIFQFKRPTQQMANADDYSVEFVSFYSSRCRDTLHVV